MALNKRQYVDGQTIVTASNLNEIQDCIIAIEGSYVPKTRKVAGKALSSDITLAASDVGAVPTSRTINAKALTGNITLSAADVGAVPVARTVNGKALSSNITLSAADVSAVPTTRTVNSKALSQDISLTASDVGAVPTGRKVNGKALSSDITLAASDVGAVPTSRTINAKALTGNITLSAADVGAVPVARTVNGKALSSNITLASGDIGDDSDAGGATVKASLSLLKGSLNSIQDAFVGKKIVLLGDSNAYLWANTNPFRNEKIDSFTSYAVGGATFNETGVAPIANQYANMVSSGIVPDYVLIWCGGNDMVFAPDYGLPLLGEYSRPTATNTFAGLRKILYDLRANYPAAKIIGITRTDISAYPAERNNYVLGMIERIYTAWNVPIISLDGIANITEEISASQQAFLTEESEQYRHYNSAGLARITEIILGVMRGQLNSHAARDIEVIFCPSTVTTQEEAIAWVQTQLLKGYGQLSLYFPQKGYKVYYNLGQNTTNITILSPAVTMASSDGKIYFNDANNIGGFNLHEIPLAADSAQALTSLDQLPTGMFSSRINVINENTAGVPTEILEDLKKAPWQFIGAWQSNRYYKGICYMPSNTPAFQPTTAKRFMLVFRAVSGATANWVFSDIDLSVSWIGAAVPT